MSTVTVCLEPETVPEALVLSVVSGERFITLRLGPVSVLVAGIDKASAAQARVIAAELVRAADQLDPPVAVEPADLSEAHV